MQKSRHGSFIKAKAIKKRVRNESHEKVTNYPDHGKREKESWEVMGSWRSYPWKQDIQEDGSSQDIELDFKFPVTARFVKMSSWPVEKTGFERV